MIFVVSGTQLPFDRLVRTVDRWSSTRSGNDSFAQIGNGRFVPDHLKWARSISQQEFRERMQQADLIVSHAGMGTILSALELGKPIVVMPRKASLGEHRNDHQLATADRLRSRGLVTVADDEDELMAILKGTEFGAASDRIARSASPELISRVSNFILAAGVEG